MTTVDDDYGREYGRVYRIIERQVHPDRPPLQPDPAVAQITLKVVRAMTACSELSQVTDSEV